MAGYPLKEQVYYKWWRFMGRETLWKKWYKVFEMFQLGAKRVDVTVPEQIIANVEFDMEFSDAVGDDGALLDGAVTVKIVSDNEDEGTSGVVFDNDVTFSDGAATQAITLEETGKQTLTLELDGIRYDKKIDVTVREEAAEVTLTGPETVESDNEPKKAIYTATLDQELAGIPVTFTTAFEADDIDAVNKGDVSDFVGAGIEVETTSKGRASITVTFSDDVDKESTITAAISDSDDGVSSSDTSELTITVDTSADE